LTGSFQADARLLGMTGGDEDNASIIFGFSISVKYFRLEVQVGKRFVVVLQLYFHDGPVQVVEKTQPCLSLAGAYAVYAERKVPGGGGVIT